MWSSFFETRFVTMKSTQNHLKVLLSDVQKTEVQFRKLVNCATFNGASLRGAKDKDPNVVH